MVPKLVLGNAAERRRASTLPEYPAPSISVSGAACNRFEPLSNILGSILLLDPFFR